MKTKVILVIIINLTIVNSQPCGFYDKQTNTLHQGANYDFSVNSRSVPLLFNWQMVYAFPSYSISGIFFVDSMCGWASSWEGIFKTTNSGFSWLYTEVNPGAYIYGSYFVNRDTGWIVGAYKLIRKTISGGARWIVQDYLQSDADFQTVHFHNAVTGIVAGGKYPGEYGYLIKTENGGNNWAELYTHPANQTPVKEQFWLNTNTGWFCGSSILLKTTNSGVNMVNYYSSIPPTSNGVNSLLGIYFVNDQTGWISASNLDHKNMYKTTNGGTNWFFQNNPIAQYQFSQLNDVIFVDENTGWSCAYVGQIIVTTNGGTNWIADLVSPNSFNCFEKYNSTKLWCGAGYGEVWYLNDLPALAIHEQGSTLPWRFDLKQNYPNPFNTSTVIQFEVPKTAFVTLTIHDMQGKEIERIIESNFGPGVYQFRYYASKLSSGMYFYSLTIDEKIIDSKKMILLK